ncbi:hypothetical protein B0A49_02225 [Cryomyces minteri]|uniref:Uncharacterized protein n=1 Tax=Cryomyces minteri TaxID=331657 RepID=A0A4U0XIR5_9PEZI|nr:hypothetical protein B0A49_02225 [Cryomyces minteri]
MLGLFALPILTGVGIGTVTGVAQGVSHQQKMNAEAANEDRMVKFHLDVECETASSKRGEVDGTMVVLRDGKLYLDHPDPVTRQPKNGAHPLTAFYFTYPDDEREATRGLVSTISVDPPMLNWIYVDADTHEARYGNRTASRAHHVGPYDWSDDESALTLEGWEGWVALEERPGEWAVYFDRKDDGLAGLRGGRRTLEIELRRRVLEDTKAAAGVKSQGNIAPYFKATREI